MGADVKNYIHPYYREATALGQGTMVQQLEGSGTTVGSRGTIFPHDVRYYRAGADVKNYILPYYREAAVLSQGAMVL